MVFWVYIYYEIRAFEIIISSIQFDSLICMLLHHCHHPLGVRSGIGVELPLPNLVHEFLGIEITVMPIHRTYRPTVSWLKSSSSLSLISST